MKAGCSVRLLQKRFKKAVGLSPKEYLKIVKLREAVEQMAYPEETGNQVTGLALDNNYYDQAHFTHAFKKIVKTTPKKFNPVQYLLSLKQKK